MVFKAGLIVDGPGNVVTGPLVLVIRILSMCGLAPGVMVLSAKSSIVFTPGFSFTVIAGLIAHVFQLFSSGKDMALVMTWPFTLSPTGRSGRSKTPRARLERRDS